MISFNCPSNMDVLPLTASIPEDSGRKEWVNVCVEAFGLVHEFGHDTSPCREDLDTRRKLAGTFSTY